MVPFIKKITHQLRLDALATDGTAPIQLTINWEGNRLRVGTGAVVQPELLPAYLWK